MHNIFNTALGWCCQQHLCSAFRLQVQREPLFVAPLSGIIDNNRVINAISRIVDSIGGVRIDYLDLLAIDDEGGIFFINIHDPLKSTVNRVFHEQASAFRQIVTFAFAHNNSPQTNPLATAGTITEQPRQQTTDTAEAI